MSYLISTIVEGLAILQPAFWTYGPTLSIFFSIKHVPKKYVVKHKSAKLFMTYAVGKLELELVRVS